MSGELALQQIRLLLRCINLVIDESRRDGVDRTALIEGLTALKDKFYTFTPPEQYWHDERVLDVFSIQVKRIMGVAL